MSCSWDESWVINLPDMGLDLAACAGNFPIKTVLKPQETLVFYGFLVRTIRGDNNEYSYAIPRPIKQTSTANPLTGKIIFGFKEFNDREQCFHSYETTSAFKTWWSNPVDLNFHNNTFHKQ